MSALLLPHVLTSTPPSPNATGRYQTSWQNSSASTSAHPSNGNVPTRPNGTLLPPVSREVTKPPAPLRGDGIEPSGGGLLPDAQGVQLALPGVGVDDGRQGCGGHDP
jgi:hypothetical protein